jgi:hypothetical protein
MARSSKCSRSKLLPCKCSLLNSICSRFPIPSDELKGVVFLTQSRLTTETFSSSTSWWVISEPLPFTPSSHPLFLGGAMGVATLFVLGEESISILSTQPSSRTWYSDASVPRLIVLCAKLSSNLGRLSSLASHGLHGRMPCGKNFGAQVLSFLFD